MESSVSQIWSSDSLKKQLLSWKVRYTNWSVYNNVSTQGFDSDAINWGDLPVELWGEIGKRLWSPVDILGFRSVCKKFRLSLPSPSWFPLWVPPSPRGNTGTNKPPPPCVITQVSIYRFELVRGSMVFEEVDRGGNFYAHLIYSLIFGNDKIRKIDSLLWWRRFFLFSELPVYFVSSAYHLRVAVRRKHDPTLWDFICNPFVTKILILSSNNGDGVNPSYTTLSDLTVVAYVSKGTMKGRLALLRLDGPRESWAWDTDFYTRVFQTSSRSEGGCVRLKLTAGS